MGPLRFLAAWLVYVEEREVKEVTSDKAKSTEAGRGGTPARHPRHLSLRAQSGTRVPRASRLNGASQWGAASERAQRRPPRRRRSKLALRARSPRWAPRQSFPSPHCLKVVSYLIFLTLPSLDQNPVHPHFAWRSSDGGFLRRKETQITDGACGGALQKYGVMSHIHGTGGMRTSCAQRPHEHTPQKP